MHYWITELSKEQVKTARDLFLKNKIALQDIWRHSHVYSCWNPWKYLNFAIFFRIFFNICRRTETYNVSFRSMLPRVTNFSTLVSRNFLIGFLDHHAPARKQKVHEYINEIILWKYNNAYIKSLKKFHFQFDPRAALASVDSTSFYLNPKTINQIHTLFLQTTSQNLSGETMKNCSYHFYSIFWMSLTKNQSIEN